MPLRNQGIERFESLLNRRQPVESVHVVDVDVIRVQTSQAGFACANDVVARRAHVVGTVPEPKGCLRRDQQIVALPCDGVAKNLFRKTIGVDIGGIKQIDSCLQADADHPLGFLYLRLTPCAKELVAASERGGAETECGYL